VFYRGGILPFHNLPVKLKRYHALLQCIASVAFIKILFPNLSRSWYNPVPRRQGRFYVA
jgi:hypothetical protein